MRDATWRARRSDALRSDTSIVRRDLCDMIALREADIDTYKQRVRQLEAQVRELEGQVDKLYLVVDDLCDSNKVECADCPLFLGEEPFCEMVNLRYSKRVTD